MSVVRMGICLLLAFAVMAFGGVEEWAGAAMEVFAGALLVYWALVAYRRETEQVYISPLLPPLVAFGLVGVVQLALHTTASSYLTRVELQLLVLYLIVLHLLSQAYLRTSHWKGLLWFLMALGFFVSIFGILQYLTFNGKLYWFRVPRFGGVSFGPYVNRNHFAGLVELLIPVALVPLVLGKVRRERILVVGLFALVPMVALVLSASRGGIVSFAVEMLILFALLMVKRMGRRRVLAAGALIVVAVLGVSWIGVDKVLQRFSTTKTRDVTGGKRAAMREDSWRIFLDHPVLGTGLGTIQMVYPPYDSYYDNRTVNHSHNDYLEALAETGTLGGLCCGWFLVVLILKSLKGWANLGSSLGASLNLSGLVGCSGILVHSLVDFNLHIPANALLFFVAAYMATARIQGETPSTPNEVSPRRRSRKRE